MSWTKPVTATRQVQTRVGDSLERIAERELGDASRWPDLVYLNGLQWPYLTDDASAASDTVLLTGSTIIVPASAAAQSPSPTNKDVYLRDLAIDDHGQLGAANGDLAIAFGVANLAQALRLRIETPLADLVYHPDYGCGVQELVGRRVTERQLTLATFVERSLRQDRRVAQVVSSTVAINGDVVAVNAIVEAINGERVAVSSQVPAS